MFLTRQIIKAFLFFAIFFLSDDLFASDAHLVVTTPANFENGYFSANSESVSAQNRKYFYDPCEKSFWQKIWGKPANPLTIIPVMYSYHFIGASGGQGNDNNNPMISFSYKGFFLGTFVNSFSIRSYSLGFQRYLIEKNIVNHLTWDFGYRVGLIAGYKNAPHGAYYHALTSRYQPFIPFIQFISDLTYQHIGLELAYTANVISGSVYVRF